MLGGVFPKRVQVPCDIQEDFSLFNTDVREPQWWKRYFVETLFFDVFNDGSP